MKTSLTIGALKMAIDRRVSPGLMHHSDRGGQQSLTTLNLLKHNGFKSV